MILVDTCIWIDFLRGGQNLHFEKAINEGHVFLSDLVRLDLIQGARASEVIKLKRVLKGFDTSLTNETTFLIAESILEKLKPSGLTLGLPDLLILAQSEQYHCELMTSDRLLLKAQKFWLK